MTDKEYAPLSAACVRALNDKLYDKRKAAALEIEKMVREFSAVNNTTQIRKLLKVLGQDFSISQNPHTRKGGLIGLAAMAIALGKDVSSYVEDMISPIVACFSDIDSRVRYYACESLYNVVKVARGSILPHFNEVFDALSKLVADPDQNVKNASELLDRLMKDIVTETGCFDVVAFMPLLRERIYTRNTFTRQFVISWVSVLYAVPDLDMHILLPEILDGLFNVLEDPTMEIKKMCESVLGDFLKSIISNPESVEFPAMINILITHAQSSDDLLLKLTAVTWIREFVALSGPAMLPFTSGILSAILPCMSFDEENRKNIKETAKAVNSSLQKLIGSREDQPLDLEAVIQVLTKQLSHTSVQTKVAALKWVHHLQVKLPAQMLNHVDTVFPVLLGTLSDLSDEVVILALEVLGEIASTKVGDGTDTKANLYFQKFMHALLGLFSSDSLIQEDRWAFIVRQLCVMLNAEDIYSTFAEILLKEKNYKFASLMVETLNNILLTSSELYDLRMQLKELKTKKSTQLFCGLYKSWCHNPVATVALCFLSRHYTHACNLVRLFGNLEITVEFLTDIDKLVQLIESPIFAYLRLELLNAEYSGPLLHALYGLLMLLPQSDAFHTLRRRLDCVPQHISLNTTVSKSQASDIPFESLLEHFQQLQDKHREDKKSSRTAFVLEQSLSNSP